MTGWSLECLWPCQLRCCTTYYLVCDRPSRPIFWLGSRRPTQLRWSQLFATWPLFWVHNCTWSLAVEPPKGGFKSISFLHFDRPFRYSDQPETASDVATWSCVIYNDPLQLQGQGPELLYGGPTLLWRRLSLGIVIPLWWNFKSFSSWTSSQFWWALFNLFGSAWL